MKKYNYLTKLVFFIISLTNHTIAREKIEQIAYDKIRCLTKEELLIKRLVNSLNYLFNNINQEFDEETIKALYYLFTNTLIDKTIANEIVKLYYKNIDNSAYYLSALVHLFIIKTTNNIEFAFIVSELIMLKKNKNVIIPRTYSHGDYTDAIVNKDLSLLVRLMFEMEYICDQKYPCKYSRAEVIKKIKLYKEYLIDTFNIKKLYLFGSFAKGTNNENSDIDFLVILDESLINIERLEQISILKEYLSELFECSVDVLDFTFALKELGENEIEHALTLI